MLEKWKQKALNMNIRKAAAVFLITSLAAMGILGGLAAANFGGRLSEFKAAAESEYEKREDEGDRENRDSREEEDRAYRDSRESDWDSEDHWREIQSLSPGDLALAVISAMIILALGIWYLALCVMWAYQKADRLGARRDLWAVLALLFQLPAIGALYLYAAAKGTCQKCGKLMEPGKNFCAYCGEPFQKQCAECGEKLKPAQKYCGSCGAKQDK